MRRDNDFCNEWVQTYLVTKLFKGIMSSDKYFLKAYKIKSVLSVWSQMVFKFFAS